LGRSVSESAPPLGAGIDGAGRGVGGFLGGGRTGRGEVGVSGALARGRDRCSDTHRDRHAADVADVVG
jgi:hypothetical protein